MSDLDSMTTRELKEKIQQLRENAEINLNKYNETIQKQNNKIKEYFAIIQKQEAKIQECVEVLESNKSLYKKSYERANNHFRKMVETFRKAMDEGNEEFFKMQKRLTEEIQKLRGVVHDLSRDNAALRDRLRVLTGGNTSSKRKRRNFQPTKLTF